MGNEKLSFNLSLSNEEFRTSVVKMIRHTVSSLAEQFLFNIINYILSQISA